MASPDADFWGTPQVLATRALDEDSVSGTGISTSLSLLYTGLTVDLQNTQELAGSTIACVQIPLSAPDRTSISVEGTLRGSFVGSDSDFARVYLLIGRASQVFDLGPGEDPWLRDFSMGVSDRGETLITLTLVARRASIDRFVRAEVDSLDVVARLEPMREGGDVLF